VTELATATAHEARWFQVGHGDVEKVLAAIESARKEGVPGKRRISDVFRSRFSKEAVLPRLIEELESSWSVGT
jgi:hypothetical protein